MRDHVSSCVPADTAERVSDRSILSDWKVRDDAADKVRDDAARGGTDWIKHLDTDSLQNFITLLFAARGNAEREAAVWRECIETAAQAAWDEA